MTVHKFRFLEQHLHLHPQKVVYWEEQSTLIVSDVHFGKTKHFRKAGIAIPQAVQQQNLVDLEKLFAYFSPKRVLFLGDLFHSRMTIDDLDDFVPFFERNSRYNIQLVLGNHDVLPVHFYNKLGIQYFEEWIEPPFHFTHEPLETTSEYYNICGHIHPAVRLKGMGKQSLRLPCFYFGPEIGILPAFGHFTGTFTLKIYKNYDVFVVAEKAIIDVSRK